MGAKLSPRASAAIGFLLVGVGLAFIRHAFEKPCVDCEQSPEATAADVAAASAEMNGKEVVTADD